MEKFIREKYSRLSDEALSLIIWTYLIDDRYISVFQSDKLNNIIRGKQHGQKVFTAPG